ncbi:anaphase-promoting complex subunit Hcn1 [Podochytrium sp. JEL0797]|nr:anaphase-promoting complex subunit Hcn1 [Podochytrium sp. JEL0797]
MYMNASLPPGIDAHKFLSGEVEFSEVYNYGLPLADGLLGGWAGWPNTNPGNSFQIQSEGPVYAIRVLCDNGVERPDLNYGVATVVNSTVLESNDRILFLTSQLVFPPNSMYDDIAGKLIPNSVVQTCSSLISMAYGTVAYHFVVDQWQMLTNGQVAYIESPDKSYFAQQPTSIHQYSVDARNGFMMLEDKYLALPLIKESVLLVMTSAEYYPTRQQAYSNLFAHGTLQDGYYHSQWTYAGVATAIGTSAHFALMQYGTGNVVPCNYYGFAGAGMLKVPDVAVWLSTSSSIIAVLVKMFEIIWWYMAQLGLEYSTYRLARRSLRNPIRFAFDMAKMLSMGMQAGLDEEDVCDVSIEKAVEALGKSRLRYGEDLLTKEMTHGNLRIGEHTKVKGIQADRAYGSIHDDEFAELDELLKNGAAAKFMQGGRTAADVRAMNLIALKAVVQKVPFLKRETGDGRDAEFHSKIASALHIKLCKVKEFVVRKGELGDCMFFIATGKYDVLVNGVKLTTLTDGAFFGELALVSDTPRAADIRCSVRGQLYTLFRHEFENIALEFPDVKEKIDNIAVKRMDELKKSMSGEGFK